MRRLVILQRDSCTMEKCQQAWFFLSFFFFFFFYLDSLECRGSRKKVPRCSCHAGIICFIYEPSTKTRLGLCEFIRSNVCVSVRERPFFRSRIDHMYIVVLLSFVCPIHSFVNSRKPSSSSHDLTLPLFPPALPSGIVREAIQLFSHLTICLASHCPLPGVCLPLGSQSWQVPFSSCPSRVPDVSHGYLLGSTISFIRSCSPWESHGIMNALDNMYHLLRAVLPRTVYLNLVGEFQCGRNVLASKSKVTATNCTTW